MRTLEPRLEKHIDLLISRYPALGEVKQAIIDAYLVMEECYEHDGKLLIAGNGGSAADSEHIAGELMKRFKTPRPVTPEFAEKLKAQDIPVEVHDMKGTCHGYETAIKSTIVEKCMSRRAEWIRNIL